MSTQILAEAGGNCDLVNQLAMVVSNPPTQAQMQALAYKVDELIDALRRA